MANIKVVVGSVYGNAQQIAEDGALQLQQMGHQVGVLSNPQLEQLVDDELDVILVITSTTGQGELPDNLLPLYTQLQDRFPLIPEARFGVIALGDSGYPDFAEAGRLMADLLRDLQARPVGETLFIDACETPDADEAAADWLASWGRLL
ncbi:flavodoxin [Marinobacterium arenosum]|uniref:flavodoxin n=1 Tax=Marinobacterium arenosum TaxID=2862496 RepID=UPI001C938992|nr:flavodoxin [Marinobacterium arenosum]MBY4676667.1 flavodoxin [Marinobacterium arenosum]